VPLSDDRSQQSFPAAEHIVFVPIKTFVSYQQIQKRTAVVPRVNIKRIQQVAADIGTHLPDVAQLQFHCSGSADQFGWNIRTKNGERTGKPINIFGLNMVGNCR
jgi:hypothetical protein